MVTAVTTTAAMMLTGCKQEAASQTLTSGSLSLNEINSENGVATLAQSSTAPSSTPSSLTSSSPLSSRVSKAASSAASPAAVSSAPAVINGLIAPVFIHGEGRGYFGCVSVVPSVFISEDEALDVIREVLLAEGIELSGDRPAVQMQIPSIDINNPHGFSWPYIYGYHTGDLELDGLDVKSKIAFEFVSYDDIINWKATNVGHMSYDSLLDFKVTAQALNDKLSQTQTDFAVATFYDPSTSNEVTKAAYDAYMKDKNSEKYIQTLRSEREKDLRAQVADFIAWLKAEKII